MTVPLPLPGATHLGGDRTRFLVWAPRAARVEVVLDPDGARRSVPLDPGEPGDPLGAERGYHHAEVDACPPGTRYRYRLHRPGATVEHPDPASRHQPDGVHGPSAVADDSFEWTDGGWSGRPLEEYAIYELHVGTFTPEGTFDAMIPRLDALADLGVTAVELMPVGQFPGTRNWGYDGAFWYAVQDSYGGPAGLRRLVDACHARGLAVVLDVIYNHFGPEGAPWDDFGPYRTGRYTTPWGPAVNVDGAGSDEVRRFVAANAVRWVEAFHVDALRLDAVHAVIDESPRHLLAELAVAVGAAARDAGRQVHLIAESDRNDPRLLRPAAAGGYGLDGMWNDDFHHALHALLTGERDGYYADFGEAGQLAAALNDRFVFTGQYSRYRQRSEGAPADDVARPRFVVCAQNHDQVGNRVRGERLTALVSFEQCKLVAALVLLSPYTPLLFMGEEWGEPAPFRYFTSHGDPDLVEAVRRGRREEFAAFDWQGEVPDPQDPATFEVSRPDWELRATGRHATLLRLHAELLRLRREHPALSARGEAVATARGAVIELRRRHGGAEAVALLNTGDAPVTAELAGQGVPWRVLLDSASRDWDGPGGGTVDPGSSTATVAPASALLLQQEDG